MSDELVIVAMTREQADEVINLWGNWSTDPAVNLHRLKSVANKALASINNTERLKASGHHYVLQGVAQDCFKRTD
jgi:hypothetical protein